MVLGGWKGELVAVIGCGMNRLDNAKPVSNVMSIRDKIYAFLSKIRLKKTNDCFTN